MFRTRGFFVVSRCVSPSRGRSHFCPGPVGPTNLARKKCCIGRGLSALRPSLKLNTSYLLYFLRYYEPRLAQRGLGSTFSAINRDDLESIPIPLLSLSRQESTARRLEQADRLRRMRHYALQMCDELLPAVFLQMFGDPMSRKAKWPLIAVGDFASVQTGNTPPREDRSNYGSHIEWIKTDNITLGHLTPNRSAEML